MAELIKGVNLQRQILIDRLILTGLNESSDNRSFHELTLTELEREWRTYEESQNV